MKNLVEFINRQLRREISGQFSRFLVVGTCAFVIDASILRLVTSLGVDPYLGRLISVPPALFFGFVMNRRFTFRYDGNQRKRVQLPKYVMVQGVGAVINYGIYATLLSLVPLVAKYLELGVAAGAIGAMVWNFAMARVLVFRDQSFLINKDG